MSVKVNEGWDFLTLAFFVGLAVVGLAIHCLTFLGYDPSELTFLDGGAQVDARNRYGETALMIAARLGEQEIVELLLDNGANPSLQDYQGSTGLDLAFRNDHTKVVQLLSRFGKPNA